MVRTDAEVSLRVAAPRRLVWAELADLPTLVSFFPEVNDIRDAGEGADAEMAIQFSLGPFDIDVNASLQIVESTEPNRLELSVAAPSLQIELEGAFDLAIGAETETVLHYGMVLRCDHPVLSRFPTLLANRLDDHVSQTTALIAERVERHARAQERLAPPASGSLAS